MEVFFEAFYHELVSWHVLKIHAFYRTVTAFHGYCLK